MELLLTLYHYVNYELQLFQPTTHLSFVTLTMLTLRSLDLETFIANIIMVSIKFEGFIFHTMYQILKGFPLIPLVITPTLFT